MPASAAEPVGRTVAPAARIESLAKTYPGTRALIDLDLEWSDGQIHALVGGNGSGKSTLIKILAGVERGDPGGRITIAGTEIAADHINPSIAHDLGLRFVHQDPGFFGDLTVAENLALGQGFKGSAARIDWTGQRRLARQLLDRFQVDARPGQLLGELRPADRTMVAVARALQDAEQGSSRILVLDEPTAALPDHEVDLLTTALRSLGEQGQTIVFVSHRLEELSGFVDMVTVLRDGRLVGSREMDGLTRSELVEMIVGHSVDASTRARTEAVGPPVLRVDDVAGGPLLSASLEVRTGEIVGLAGLLGSGRTELLNMIFGYLRRDRGRIELSGEVVELDTPAAAMKQGVGHVPEDRLREAMFADLAIRENFSAAQVDRYWRRGRLDTAAEREDAAASISRYLVKAPSAERSISTLSGGNQQKVIIGRWLRTEPSLLLLDEPTHGVDVGAREEIYDLIETHTRQGMGVLFASSDFEELATVCDRVLVLVDGTIGHEVTGVDLDAALLARLAYSEGDVDS